MDCIALFAMDLSEFQFLTEIIQSFPDSLQDIQDLLLTWAEHLNRASAVFVRAPSYNKTIFFGGRGGPLQKSDPRVRSLPIVTRRATFREVQRVHEVLSTVQVYGVFKYMFRAVACCLFL